MFLIKKQLHFWRKVIAGVIILTFNSSLILPPQRANAQTILNLPVPGSVVPTTAIFAPAMIKGINLYPDNPLKFDFIIDKGDAAFTDEEFEKESTKLIKYFLSSLTVPEDEMWVNLSPYEKNRIVPQDFGKTEMGRDLLAQDYMLKQLTASLMNPDDKLGGEFWQRVYAKAQEKYGTTDIPMNTFNKIWIVPEKAVVYEHEKGAFVVKSHLKVMLEEDYLALEANKNSTKHGLGDVTKENLKIVSGVQSAIIKDLLIPEIEKEVNEGQTFANLRQIYNSVILASWYKQALKETVLGQVYVDQKKTKGVETDDKTINEQIYNQYVESFKKGVYNYIKEDYDPETQEVVNRKYFSGGEDLAQTSERMEIVNGAGIDAAELAKQDKNLNNVTVDFASVSSPNAAKEEKEFKNPSRRRFLRAMASLAGGVTILPLLGSHAQAEDQSEELARIYHTNAKQKWREPNQDTVQVMIDAIAQLPYEKLRETLRGQEAVVNFMYAIDYMFQKSEGVYNELRQDDQNTRSQFVLHTMLRNQTPAESFEDVKEYAKFFKEAKEYVSLTDDEMSRLVDLVQSVSLDSTFLTDNSKKNNLFAIRNKNFLAEAYIKLILRSTLSFREKVQSLEDIPKDISTLISKIRSISVSEKFKGYQLQLVELISSHPLLAKNIPPLFICREAVVFINIIENTSGSNKQLNLVMDEARGGIAGHVAYLYSSEVNGQNLWGYVGFNPTLHFAFPKYASLKELMER